MARKASLAWTLRRERIAKGRSQRIAIALDRVGLAGAAAKHYRSYSLGMKQRLTLAAALLRPRELVVLDEPPTAWIPRGHVRCAG